MTVTKAELVNLLSDATGLTKVDVEVIVNGFLYHIMEAIQNGDRVEIRGFGSFYAKERMPRIVKNPKTNTVMHIDHRFVPIFRPAKFFKESVNQCRLKNLRKEENES